MIFQRPWALQAAGMIVLALLCSLFFIYSVLLRTNYIALQTKTEGVYQYAVSFEYVLCSNNMVFVVCIVCDFVILLFHLQARSGFKKYAI